MIKNAKIIRIAVVLLVLALTMIYVYADFDDEESPVLYIKDSEMYMFKNGKMRQVTENIYENNVDGDSIERISSLASAYTTVSSDGKRLIYPDNFKAFEGYELYSLDLTSGRSKPVLIDMNINTYQISFDGSSIAYCITNIVTDVEAHPKLYLRKIGEDNAEIITESLDSYYLHPDEAYVLYRDKGTYYKYDDENSQTLTTNMMFSDYGENGTYYVRKHQDGNLYDICFHDGEKEIVIATTPYCDYIWRHADKGMIAYMTLVGEEQRQLNIAVNGRNIPIDTVKLDTGSENFPRIYIAEGGNAVYYADAESDLYRVKIADGAAGDAELIDSKVFSYIGVLDNGNLVYFKDDETPGYSRELHVDGEKIASNTVAPLSYNEQDSVIASFGDAVYFYSDKNDENSAVLNVYKDGVTQVISENVKDFSILSDGRVVFLRGYEDEYKNGTLFVYDGEKTVLIDENVGAIVHGDVKSEYKTGIISM